MYNILVLLSLVSIATCRDLIVGTNTEGRKIYDEVRHASPTIWRQIENVTVAATDAEVISRVVITDLRPDKDGDVKVVEGGEGQKNVTVELKSPTVLRGYDFQIQVFTIAEDKFKPSDKKIESTDATQSRVQRNPANISSPSFNPPRDAADDSKQEPAFKSNTTPMSDDTKVNQDQTKSTNKDSENVNDKPSSVPVPFVGNLPQAVNIPTDVPRTEGANKDAVTRRTRAALNPEIPEENQNPQKETGENQDDVNGKSFTHRPLLTSRQTFNSAESTTKPLTDGNRDARDTQQGSNSASSSTQNPELNTRQGTTKPNENSPQHPALFPRQGTFNRPTPASITSRPDNDGKREARDTEKDKEDDNPLTPKEISGQRPVFRQSSLNRDAVSTTNKPDTDGKRDARDTEQERKNDNAPTLKENSDQHPALVLRQGSFNRAAVSTTNKPDTDGKRDARDTEQDKKSDNPLTPKENSDQHPALVLRQGSFNRAAVSTTNKPDTDSKRNARDTEQERKNENAPTVKENSDQHPALVPRQGSFNRAAVSTTNKPDTDSKRDARDTDQDKKSDNPLTPKENSDQHPALVLRQGSFNRAAVSTTNKPDTDSKRDARDTDQDKKSDNPLTPNENSPQHPALVFRQGSFNRAAVSTTNKPDTDGKREARDTEQDKSETSSQLPALVSRQSSFNGPALPISTTNKPDDSKRDARGTEEDKKTNNTPNDNSSQHPALVSRQGSFKATPAASQPENDGKRDSRDTKHDNKSNNEATTKAVVENSTAHPRIFINSLPTANSNSTEADKTTERTNEDVNRPRSYFVPPPGYIKVVSAADENERVARDVQNDDKKTNSPRSYGNAQSEASTPVNKEYGLRTQTTGVRIPYQPLPYSGQGSTSTLSPRQSSTDKPQSKRETDLKTSETEQKDSEEGLIKSPRIFGGQNYTATEQRPVISIQ